MQLRKASPARGWHSPQVGNSGCSAGCKAEQCSTVAGAKWDGRSPAEHLVWETWGVTAAGAEHPAAAGAPAQQTALLNGACLSQHEPPAGAREVSLPFTHCVKLFDSTSARSVEHRPARQQESGTEGHAASHSVQGQRVLHPGPNMPLQQGAQATL